MPRFMGYDWIETDDFCVKCGLAFVDAPRAYCNDGDLIPCVRLEEKIC